MVVVSAFLATEGARVLQGERGPRARREQRRAARQSLALFGAAAIVSALAFIGVGGTALARTFALPLITAAAVAVSMRVGRLKSSTGEILAAAALAAGAVPVARASGLDLGTATWMWLLWTTAFVGATLGVRGLIATQGGRGGTWERAAALAVVWVAAALLLVRARSDWPSALVALGFLPTAGLVSAAALLQVTVRRLRTLGWSLVAASAMLALAMIAALRVG
jgi:hypothetical protein